MSLPNGFTTSSPHALPLHVLQREQFAAWRESQAPATQAWADAQQFVAAPGTLLLLPGEHGIAGAVIGVSDALDPYSYAHTPYGLPQGDWKLAASLDDAAHVALQLGWGLGSYRFDR